MAKEAIEMIKAAEKEALDIKNAVQERDKTLCGAAEKNGKELLEHVRIESVAKATKIVRDASETSDKIISDMKARAELEADGLKSSVKDKIPDAVSIIVGGL